MQILAESRQTISKVVITQLKLFLGTEDNLEEQIECINVLFLVLNQIQTNLKVSSLPPSPQINQQPIIYTI